MHEFTTAVREIGGLLAPGRQVVLDTVRKLVWIESVTLQMKQLIAYRRDVCNMVGRCRVWSAPEVLREVGEIHI